VNDKQDVSKEKIKPHIAFFRKILGDKKIDESIKDDVEAEVKVEEKVEDKPVGLTDRVKLLEDKAGDGVEKKDDKKKFNLPLGIRLRANSLTKRDEILVFGMKKNHGFNPKICKIKSGGVLYEGIVRDFNEGDIFLYRGKVPCLVMPEWSLSAYSGRDRKDLVTPLMIMIRNLERAEDVGKNLFAGKNVIWIVLGAIIIGYAIFGTGGG